MGEAGEHVNLLPAKADPATYRRCIISATVNIGLHWARGTAGVQEARTPGSRSPTRRCGCSSRAASTTSPSQRSRLRRASPRRRSSTTSRRRRTSSSTRCRSERRRSSRRSADASPASRSSARSAVFRLGECPRLCSPGFATFARIIEESPALQAKELEVMAHFAHVLAEAIQRELARRRARRADRRRPADQRSPAVLPRRTAAGARGQARACGDQTAARRPGARVRPARARARRLESSSVARRAG